MIWKESSLKEALAFAATRTISEHHPAKAYTDSPWDADVCWFTDGCAVACRSDASGPYSEVTPDIDLQPPEWWTGTPNF